MRAVLDTNVIVSALVWGGTPLALFRAATEGGLLLYTSPALLDELSNVLARGHLASRLEASRTSVEQALALYARLAQIIQPTQLQAGVSRDPDDDAVLGVAVAAQAHFVVSGDGDLLVLGMYAGTRIVTPAQALTILNAGPKL